MIQAQRAVVVHVAADQPREALQPLRLHDGRILRRYAPALTVERQRIRRSTDFSAQAVTAEIRPSLGTGRSGTHGVVAVQTDGHAELASQRLRAAQLLVRQ